MGTEQAVSLIEIKEYIWNRYIENEDASIEMGEDEILDFFRDYYSRVPIEGDSDNFYFGILMFERAWEVPERKEEFFFLAREVFLLYREITGETDWDAVEDRLADIDDSLEEEGADLQALAGKYALPAPPQEEQDGLEAYRSESPEGMILVPPAVVRVPGVAEPVEVPAFYVDVHPVTVAEFQKFLDATQYRAPKYWGEDSFKEGDQPVVGVSFMDAEKYAEWAGKAIPTHEQWVAAARGSADLPFPWEGEMDAERANCKSSDEEALLSVGSFPEGASSSGVEDLMGGVWEWTVTWFDREQEYKIIKGGSFVDPPSLIGIDTILYASPKEKIDNIGFRCVRPVSGIA